MTSQEEFTAFLHSDPKAGYQNDGGKDDPEWMSSWAQRGQSSGYGSTSPIAGAPKPPQAPRRVSPLNSEQSPLLQPPSPVKPPPKQPTAGPPRPKSHGRSRSDFVWASQDPSHPLMTGGTSKPSGPSGLPPMKHHRSSSRGNKPPRVATSGTMALPGASALGMSAPPATPTGASGRGSHRRAKSDIPTSFGGHRSISKSDLLKNFPDPRWGGKPLNISHHGRKRTGGGGPLLDEGDLTSGYGSTGGDNAHPLLNASGGLGGHGTIGSVTLDPKVRKSKGHARTMSDASLASVTTDMAKSALFKGVTEHGTIQLQLPKDSFRILMDSSLEAGCVYKRKLVDNEDEFFVEFHTIEDNLAAGSHHHNQANAKRLPPDLYVMAVDSTLYRRILDEVVDSQNMPCGTFFCGHHEDVRHPDVKIAAFIVGIVFIVLLAGTVTMKG